MKIKRFPIRNFRQRTPEIVRRDLLFLLETIAIKSNFSKEDKKVFIKKRKSPGLG